MIYSQDRSAAEGKDKNSRCVFEAAAVTDGNPLGLSDPSSPSPPEPWRWIGLFTFVLLAMAMAATVLVVTASKDRKASLLKAEEARLRESVNSRAEVLETWLQAKLLTSKRLTSSRVFRLFVNDLSSQNFSAPLPRSLQDQRPYFRQLLSEFTRQNEMVRVTILRRDGVILLTSPGPALPIANLFQQNQEALQSTVRLSPIRPRDRQKDRFVVDVIMPVPQVQTESADSADPAAFIVLTLPIGDILERVLTSMDGRDHETISLLQRRNDGVDRLSLTSSRIELAEHQPQDDLTPGMEAPFSRRGEGPPVYSLGTVVEALPWTLYHAVDARAVLSPVQEFTIAASLVSLLCVILLTATFSALWWRRERNYHQGLVDLYRIHARNIDRQRQFLRSVLTSMGDWLAVSGPAGELIYVNSSLKEASGRPSLLNTGETWDNLIKRPANGSDCAHDLVDLVDASVFDTVEIAGERHIVSSCVSDLLAEDGNSIGKVHVVRDHTKVIEERRKRLLSMAHTVDAFIHAVELRDPFLLGHTERLRSLAIAIGQKLDLSNIDLSSLALAASLSQIGKIFMPEELLTKPGRHTAQEKDMMQGHIRHAVKILSRIEFELPIVDIVSQMHERLDGSGYPQNLAGEQISLCARILGVVDVFCARTSPRSYRERISVGKTLYYLASNDQRYDLKVVSALAELIGHDDEIKIMPEAETSLIDSNIWRKRRVKQGILHELV